GLTAIAGCDATLRQPPVRDAAPAPHDTAGPGTGGQGGQGGAPTPDASPPPPSRDAGPPPARDAAPRPVDAAPVSGPMPTAMQMFNSPCLSTPDPDVAAGPDLVGTAIQWTAYFFKKDTGTLDHMYKWKALRGNLISDTHIVYDSTSKRWYITTIVQLEG